MRRLRTPTVAPGQHRAFRTATLACLALVATGDDTAAQVDYLPLNVHVTQSIQTGNLDLVGERPTFVRTTVRRVGGGANPLPIDGFMRVFDGGVELPESPFFSDNGPLDVPSLPDQGVLDHTLNFTFIPPVSDDVTIQIDVNPPGPNFVPGETNPSNNTLVSTGHEFVPRGIPNMIYSPIDYPQGGGVPNDNLIRPGVGDNFIQGIYPVPDWDYHRTDAPSKLWTSSLSGSGSTLNNSLTTDLNLTVPLPDYIYGWVPGSLPYNGQAIIGGVASMGNTQPIRHQRTFAHELGHCTGLFHDSAKADVWGIDVEHHLAVTEGLPKLRPPSANGVMVAGQLTNTAWTEDGDYNAWLNTPKFQANNAALVADQSVPSLMVGGVWNSATGQVTMTDVLQLPEARVPSTSGASSEVLLTAYAGDVEVRHLRVSGVTSADCAHDADSEFEASPLVGFNALVPAFGPDGRPVDKLVIAQGGSRPLSTLVLERSAHAPEIAFTNPTGSVLDDARLVVAWEGSDADGDELTYFLRWSRDGVKFSPLHTSTRDTSFTVDLSQLPALVDGQGFFELLASDGLNTTVVRTEPLTRGPQFAGAGGNPPWSHILTPDTGVSLLQGQTALLHGMGWDLEDDSISGADTEWSSDVDGVIGNGRRISTKALSPGVHVLSFAVTDTDGMTSVAQSTVTVLARDLPDVDGEICQTDLGLGGPGSAVLEVCGGDLSSGTTADLSLTGAPANVFAWLVLGTASVPTPFKGGLLAPSPLVSITTVSTDGSGSFGISGIPGGGGPASFVVQFVIQDGAQTLGFGLSNAVQLDYLP